MPTDISQLSCPPTNLVQDFNCYCSLPWKLFSRFPKVLRNRKKQWKLKNPYTCLAHRIWLVVSGKFQTPCEVGYCRVRVKRQPDAVLELLEQNLCELFEGWICFSWENKSKISHDPEVDVSWYLHPGEKSLITILHTFSFSKKVNWFIWRKMFGYCSSKFSIISRQKDFFTFAVFSPVSQMGESPDEKAHKSWKTRQESRAAESISSKK